MVYTCEDGKRTHYSEVEVGFCDLCRVKLLEDERRMLFEFARVLNNYRKFESDDDVYHQIDEFLSFYDPCNQPERSKREDSVLDTIPEYGSKSSLNFDDWQRRCGALNSMET